MVPIPMRDLSAGASLDAAFVRKSPIKEYSVAISVALRHALKQKQALDSGRNDPTVFICNESYAAKQLFDRERRCF